MTWLYDLIYGTVESLTGLSPDNTADALMVDGDLYGAISNMWSTPQDLICFVLYWLVIGLLLVGLVALFRWLFTFTFRLFRLD